MISGRPRTYMHVHAYAQERHETAHRETWTKLWHDTQHKTSQQPLITLARARGEMQLTQHLQKMRWVNKTVWHKGPRLMCMHERQGGTSEIHGSTNRFPDTMMRHGRRSSAMTTQLHAHLAVEAWSGASRAYWSAHSTVIAGSIRSMLSVHKGSRQMNSQWIQPAS